MKLGGESISRISQVILRDCRLPLCKSSELTFWGSSTSLSELGSFSSNLAAKIVQCNT